MLSAYKVTIESTKDFDSAQICTGGIPLNELTTDFESKIVKDLFVTGELLDLQGICGGYNLTLCWISGILAGKAIGDMYD